MGLLNCSVTFTSKYVLAMLHKLLNLLLVLSKASSVNTTITFPIGLISCFSKEKHDVNTAHGIRNGIFMNVCEENALYK